MLKASPFPCRRHKGASAWLRFITFLIGGKIDRYFTTRVYFKCCNIESQTSQSSPAGSDVWSMLVEKQGTYHGNKVVQWKFLWCEFSTATVLVWRDPKLRETARTVSGFGQERDLSKKNFSFEEFDILCPRHSKFVFGSTFV